MGDKPNYNDGNWHAWEGGECPVHPESEIQAVRGNSREATVVTWKAKEFQEQSWLYDGMSYSIIAFRVISVAPRRFWINLVSGTASTHEKPGMIEVVEVLK